MFHAIFNLTNLNGKNGFTANMNINDVHASGPLGAVYASNAGDVNGDGIDDIVSGISFNGQGGYQSEIFVFFGKTTFPAQVNPTKLDGSNGFSVTGELSSLERVGNAGDINGDGVDDLLIAGGTVGNAVVVFGTKLGFPATFSLNDINGRNGFSFTGSVSYDFVYAAGDVNGDGVDDIAFGSQGVACIAFGSKSGFSPQFNLDNINGNNGFLMLGKYPKGFPLNIKGVGDINSDGIDDIAMCCDSSNADDDGSRTGNAYIVYGSKSVFPNQLILSDLTSKSGFIIPLSGWVSNQIQGIGDVNGDSIDDIIISILACPTPISPATINCNSGVIFGNKAGFLSPFDILTLSGENGFYIDTAGYGPLSIGINGAGDVNGDGVQDILIAGFNNSNTITQGDSASIVFGSKDAFSRTFSLSELNGKNGLVLQSDISGAFLHPNGRSGDVNGDGIDDIVITSYEFLEGRSDILVVFGEKEMPASTQGNNDIGAIIGGAAGGVVFAGLAAGLFLYGKSHGWWCAGESGIALHDNDYGAIQP